MKKTITIPELKSFLDEVLDSNDIQKLIELILFIRSASQEQIARIRVRLEADSKSNTKVQLLTAALLLTGKPESYQVSAATQLVRDVLTVEPNNIVAINLLARLGMNFNVMLEEMDFFGEKKPDKLYEQLAILYRQSLLIQRNLPAIMGIMICIAQGVKAISIDFADGETPSNNYELEAKLLREALRLSKDRNIKILSHLTRLIALGHTIALNTDFSDNQIPDTKAKQVLKLYREILSIERTQSALINIAILFRTTNEAEISAEANDFLGGQIPAKRSEQAANLFREAIRHNRNSIAIAQLGLQILNGEISAMDGDFEDGKIPPTASEQAGKLFRESLKIKVKDVVVRTLANMMENGTLIAINDDFFDGVVPETPALQAAKFRQQYSIPVQAAATNASTATHSTDTANIVRTLKRNRSVSPTQRTQMTTNTLASLETDLSVDKQSNLISTPHVVSQLRQLSSNPGNDPIEVRDSLSKLRKLTIDSSKQFRNKITSGI